MRQMADDPKSPVNSDIVEKIRLLLKEALEKEPSPQSPMAPGDAPAVGKFEITMPNLQPRNPHRRRLINDIRPPGPNAGRRRGGGRGRVC